MTTHRAQLQNDADLVTPDLAYNHRVRNLTSSSEFGAATVQHSQGMSSCLYVLFRDKSICHETITLSRVRIKSGQLRCLRVDFNGYKDVHILLTLEGPTF